MTRADFETFIANEGVCVVDSNGTSTHYLRMKNAESFDSLPRACYGCIQILSDKWLIYFTDHDGRLCFFRETQNEDDALDKLSTFLLYLKSCMCPTPDNSF